MPELPEVETTVRGLRAVVDGRRLTRVELRRADLRRAFPVDLGQRLTGATVTGLGRRAKYGLIHTDRADTLVFHLGMSGRWRIDPALHALVRWTTANLVDAGDVAGLASADVVFCRNVLIYFADETVAHVARLLAAAMTRATSMSW